MPTYKNSTNARAQIAGRYIEPHGTIESTLWVQEHGFERVSDKPMYNPVILSERFTQSVTVQIPKKEQRFSIHFYAEKGSPKVYYSSKENEPVLKLYTGARWNVRVYERMIEKLELVLDADDVLWVQIERI